MRTVIFTAALFATACAPAPTPAAPETEAALVEHGRYLVDHVAFCGDCHTPYDGNQPDAARTLQGAPTELPPPLAAYAPALAGIPAQYTPEQFAAVLQTGQRPDGSAPLAPMPPFRLNERDARAITAYIATLPAEDEATAGEGPS